MNPTGLLLRIVLWVLWGGFVSVYAQNLPPPPVTARDVGEMRMQIYRLEERLTKAEQKGLGERDVSVAMFGIAGLCALWAQNTSRNAWLWFAFGLLLGPVALFFMLYKNSRDRRRDRLIEGDARERRHELLRRAVAGERIPPNGRDL